MGFFDYFFSNRNHRVVVHQHGHRCYSEGLTAHEQHVVTLLAKGLNPDQYYIFNNVTIPSSSLTTTQIDHIVISEYGIFVIESKDYGGWIFGNKGRSEWTQSMITGKKYKFQNPLHQNIAHIFALKEQLPFLKNCIYNVVLFSDRCTFKTPMPLTVMQDSNVVQYIRTKQKRRLTEGDLMMVIGKLSILCQTITVTQAEHIANLHVAHNTAANPASVQSSSRAATF